MIETNPHSGRFLPISGVRVLGVTGAARHGKDTLAQFLMACVPGAERFAFSDAISAYARVTQQMTTRDPIVLQEVGYRLRQQRPRVWLDALYGSISDRAPKLAIITGVRFADEAEMIRDMGGQLVRVLRTERDGRIYRASDRDLHHPVERAIEALLEDTMIAAPSGDLETLRRFAEVLATEAA